MKPEVTKDALGANPAPWKLRGPNAYLEGQAHIDALDAVVVPIERWWGVGRLRTLVPPEMAAAFDRQRALLNQAIWDGDLEDVKRETARMKLAWQTLNAEATLAGHQPLSATVLAELVVDGTVVAIVKDATHAHAVQREGRRLQVWTLDEVASALAAFPALIKAKDTFPGAVAEPRRQTIADPLHGLDLVPDLTPPPGAPSRIGTVKREVEFRTPTEVELDDEIPF
jgi:hypothetical protein